MAELRTERPVSVLEARHNRLILVCPVENLSEQAITGGLLAELRTEEGQELASAGLRVVLPRGAMRRVHIVLPAFGLTAWEPARPVFYVLRTSFCDCDGRRQALETRRIGLPSYRRFSAAEPFWRNLRAVALWPAIDALRFSRMQARVSQIVRTARRAGFNAVAVRASGDLDRLLIQTDEQGLHVLLCADAEFAAADAQAAARAVSGHPSVLAWVIQAGLSQTARDRLSRLIRRRDKLHPVLALTDVPEPVPPIPGLARLLAAERPAKSDISPLPALGLPDALARPPAAAAPSSPAERRVYRRVRKTLRELLGDLTDAVGEAAVARSLQNAALLQLSGAEPAVLTLPVLFADDPNAAKGAVSALGDVPAGPALAVHVPRPATVAGGEVEAQVRLGPAARDLVDVALEIPSREPDLRSIESSATLAFAVPADLDGPTPAVVTARFHHAGKRRRAPVLLLPAAPPDRVRVWGFDMLPTWLSGADSAPRLDRIDAAETPVLVMNGQRLERRASGRQLKHLEHFTDAGGRIVILVGGRIAGGWLPFDVELTEWSAAGAVVDAAQVEGETRRLPLDGTARVRRFLIPDVEGTQLQITGLSAVPGLGANGRPLVRCGATAVQVQWGHGRIRLISEPHPVLGPLAVRASVLEVTDAYGTGQ